MASTKDLIQKRSVAQQSDALKQQVNQEYLNTQPQPQPKPQISLAESAEQIETPKTITINSPEMDAFREQVIAKNLYGVETPEEKAKRERNDALRIGYTGLVDGLSSLANLYYTTKWAPNSQRQMAMPQLQQDLYRERLERDRKLQNFRQWQQKEAQGRAQREHELKKLAEQQKYNKWKEQFDAQQRYNELTAKQKHDLDVLGVKNVHDFELLQRRQEFDKIMTGIEHKNSVALKAAPTYDDLKPVESAMASDETMMTRNTPLTDTEVKQIIYMSPDYYDKFEDYRKKSVKVNEYGEETISYGDVDYRSMAADILANGSISNDVLKEMGFKQSKSKRAKANNSNKPKSDKREKVWD